MEYESLLVVHTSEACPADQLRLVLGAPTIVGHTFVSQVAGITSKGR